MGTADRDQAGIFRRIVAGQRGLIIPEFQHHIARPRRAFPGLVLAAAHQKLRAVFLEYRPDLTHGFLLRVHVVNIGARDRLALCHPRSSLWFFGPAPARSRPGWRPPRPWYRRLPSRDGRPPD